MKARKSNPVAFVRNAAAFLGADWEVWAQFEGNSQPWLVYTTPTAAAAKAVADFLVRNRDARYAQINSVGST